MFVFFIRLFTKVSVVVVSELLEESALHVLG